MFIVSNRKAVSTLILIILLLCSAVFGGVISYMVVMSHYYNMPQPRVLVEDAAFPILDATYFNVTILNPSNSASDANITGIRLRVEGKDQVLLIAEGDAEPGFPFSLRSGAKQTFKCKENWSNFTGETVRIQALAGDALTTGQSFVTPKVEWDLRANFDPSTSVEYFYLVIENSDESIINLTVSQVVVIGMPINVTPTLPFMLSPGRTGSFRCDWSWQGYLSVQIWVKTEEGYEFSHMVKELPISTLFVSKIEFNYTDSGLLDVAVTSAEDSAASSVIQAINLTLQDGSTVPIVDVLFGGARLPLASILYAGRLIQRNTSKTFTCFWDWMDHRNENITVEVYTQEGFTVQSLTTETPPEVVWNLTGVDFDLDHTDYFLVDVKNMPVSLHEINVTEIRVDGTDAIFMNQTIPVGGEISYNCTLDWLDLMGEEVNVSIVAYDLQTEESLNLSRLVEISDVGLKILGDNLVIGDLYDPNIDVTIPYLNVTISNSVNSVRNVTITKIVLDTESRTMEIDNALTYPKLSLGGYLLMIGGNVTIVCLSDWTEYLGPRLTITVHTREGIQVSRTWSLT